MWTHTSPYGTSQRRFEHWKEILARTEIGAPLPGTLLVRANPIPLIELPVNGGPIPDRFGRSEWRSWASQKRCGIAVLVLLLARH